MGYSEKKRRERIMATVMEKQPVPVITTAVVLDEALKQRLMSLAVRLEELLLEINKAFEREDWQAKDRTAVRALVLARYGVGLYGGRRYRLSLAFRACRAFHALPQEKMRLYITRFQTEMSRCLGGIPDIPDSLIATFQKVHQRAVSAKPARRHRDQGMASVTL